MDQTEKDILKLLSEMEHDISIEEISKRLGKSRGTISKALFVLESREMIVHRSVGKAKLYSPKGPETKF